MDGVWSGAVKLLLLAASERPVGNVKRNSSGSVRPIARETALQQLNRARRGRRFVTGLLYDNEHPGFDPTQWQHVVRRPHNQAEGDLYRGRTFKFEVESSHTTGTMTKVAVCYRPRNMDPRSVVAARDACAMLTEVRTHTTLEVHAACVVRVSVDDFSPWQLPPIAAHTLPHPHSALTLPSPHHDCR